MSEIEELRNELRGAIDRAEHIMEGSGIQPYLQYSTGALTELLTHIDHLTAELARRHHQVETLRAACRGMMTAMNVFGNCLDASGDIKDPANVRRLGEVFGGALNDVQSALAATAEPGGEGGGR